MGFGNYAAQTPHGRHAAFTFEGLRNADGTNPIVHVEFIGDREWNQHVISLAGNKDEAEGERRLRALVARHVRKLDHVYHADGTPAGVEDAAAFVAEIPNHDFRRLLVFARSDEEFREYASPEAVAGK